MRFSQWYFLAVLGEVGGSAEPPGIIEHAMINNEQYKLILQQEQVIRQALKVYQIKALAVLEAYYAEALIYDLIEGKHDFIAQLVGKAKDLHHDCIASGAVWGLDLAVSRFKSTTYFTSDVVKAELPIDEALNAVFAHSEVVSKLSGILVTDANRLLIEGVAVIRNKLLKEADDAYGDPDVPQSADGDQFARSQLLKQAAGSLAQAISAGAVSKPVRRVVIGDSAAAAAAAAGEKTEIS